MADPPPSAREAIWRQNRQQSQRNTMFLSNGLKVIGLVATAGLIFALVTLFVTGMLVVQLLGAAGSQVIEVVRYSMYAMTLGSSFNNPALAMGNHNDTAVARRVLEVIEEFKANLSKRGQWLPEESVARLLLAGTEQPHLPLSAHLPGDVLDEHALLPIRMGGHFWHIIQQGTVHTVVTIVAMRASWVFINPALRRRQWIHVRNRPKVVFASWSCVLLSVVLLRFFAIAFGGWAAMLSLTGLILHLDLYHTDVRLRVG